MNNKKRLILALAILMVMATLLFAIVPVTPNFIVAYGFLIVGIGINITILYKITNQFKSPQDYGIPLIWSTYIGIQLVISLVALGMEWLNVYGLPTTWFAVIHIGVLSFFSIKTLGILSGKEHIEKLEDKIKTDIAPTKKYMLLIERILSKGASYQENDSEMVKQINNLYDTIRYADPISTREVREIELQIEIELLEMSSLLDKKYREESIRKMHTINDLIQERNRILKMNK